MDLDLSEHRGGTRLRLRVKPGARSDAILGAHGGALKLSVSAAPEKGKANGAVCALIARALELPASTVEIVSGQTGRDKAVWIPLPPDEVGRRLSSARS